MPFLRTRRSLRGIYIIGSIIGLASTLACLQTAMAAGGPATRSVPLVIRVKGNVFDPFTRTPVADAKVEFVQTASRRILATTESDAQGVYTVALQSDGKPVHAHVRAQKAGRVTSLIFPPEPLTADLEPCPPFAGTRGCILIAMLTPAGADAMAGFAGVVRDPAKGEVLFIAADCAGTPVAGATGSIAPGPEQLVYTQGPFPAPMRGATDPSGRAFGFNIKPGKAMIQVRYPDHSVGVAPVLVEAGAISIGSTLPGNIQCSE